MKCNKQMKALLLELEQSTSLETIVDLNNLESILFPKIYQRLNDNGEPYICVNNFRGLNRNFIKQL